MDHGTRNVGAERRAASAELFPMIDIAIQS